MTGPTSGLDLAVIGNCRISALVDKQGAIVWCCLPQPDGDPVFCNLLSPKLGSGAGRFAFDMEEMVESEQSYLANTAILQTILRDKHGNVLRITDFAPRFRQFDRNFRPISLVRKIEPIAGQPRIRIRLRPTFEWGAVQPTMSLGSNHIRYISPSQTLRLTTDAPLTYITEDVPFLVDAPLHFIFGADESLTSALSTTVGSFLDATRDYWIDWTRALSVPFEWQEAVIRAGITLKLCSFEETGAIMAALTTSLPEFADSGRNWDYRFCWLRDAYFTVQALNQLCATRTMEHFIRYITNAVAFDPARRLRPMYAISHSMSLQEIEVPELAGYRGMGPVRRGNAAYLQEQHDTYGSVILAAAQVFFDRRMPRQGDMDLFHRLERLGEHARVAAYEPDASLWEFRGKSRVHTFSSAMCWAACDRLAKIAHALQLPDRAAYWRSHADAIRTTILERAWSETENSFVDAFDGGNIDASLLLLHEIGFVAAQDPRYIGTVEAVERHLKRGDHLLRYAVADDFGVPETAFTVCTFWYINALAAIGRRDEARAMFEHLLSCRNHVGLLSEDIDPKNGQLWGNFPQTYSLVGLVLCAQRLSKTWEEAFWRGS
ncbi:MAG: glycoside hydrolase family 15 protein [Rhodospirillales bacterium]